MNHCKYTATSKTQIPWGMLWHSRKTSTTVCQSGTQNHQNPLKTKNLNPEIDALRISFPKAVWLNSKKSKNLYLVDKNVARDIAQHVTEENPHLHVLEANPGPGILSKALLEAGVTRLRVFEDKPCFQSSLKVLQQIHSVQLDIIEKDLMLLQRIYTKDYFRGSNEMKSLFKGIDKKAWKDGLCCKIFSVIHGSRSINFIRSMFISLATMSSVFQYGRCQFFLLLSEPEYSRVVAQSKQNFTNYRSATVFYNLFFEIKHLNQYSVTNFLPEYPAKGNKKANQTHFLHLIRLTTKANLLDMPCHYLPELYFFIRHHLTKRKRLVIPSLEQWIPHCGPRFIKKGMKVFTKFGDLQPEQILQLFLQFSAFSEYKDSPFRAAVANFYEIKTAQDEKK